MEEEKKNYSVARMMKKVENKKHFLTKGAILYDGMGSTVELVVPIVWEL